jgi:hypothetical protein
LLSRVGAGGEFAPADQIARDFSVFTLDRRDGGKPDRVFQLPDLTDCLEWLRRDLFELIC